MAIDLSLSPYYDDYDEDKGFHRLLFRPGRAVQARELTQLQTILQNQIRRFGQNIFLEGTVVIPGGVTIDTNYQYVKVQDADISDIDVGATIVGSTSNLIAELIQGVAIDGADPATLYIRYTGGGSGDGGKFSDGETLTYTNPDLSGGSFTAAASSAAGAGTKVNLDKGVYFVKGYFVVATTQTLIVEKYGIPTGTFEVGLVSTEEIVTSGDDSSLLSNAQGTNNENAPGADRYKLALTLTKKASVENTDGSIDVDYFTIATIKDAVVVEALTRTQYALLGDELARRTYDESGNYTVKPFFARSELTVGDDTTLDFIIDPGRAYVKGYEVNKTISTTVTQDRALTTKTLQARQTPATFGNYVRTEIPEGTGANLPDISEFEQVSLRDSGNTVRGTARVRAVQRESTSIYRFYLFDIQMNVGYGFNQVRDLYARAGAFEADLITADSVEGSVTPLTTDSATLYDTANNNLLFPLPRERVSSLLSTVTTVVAQRHVTFTTNGSGVGALDSGSADETWADTSDWIVVRNDTGAVVTPTFSATGGQTIDLSGLNASTAHTAITYLDKAASGQQKTKTLTASAGTVGSPTAVTLTPEGDNSVILDQHDIFSLISVTDPNNGNADITSRYTLDNGQRDNFYDLGRLYLKSNATAPSGDVNVTFLYFAHSGGSYCSVDSYTSFIGLSAYSYADIPSHTLADGTTIRLADAFDFRPLINDAQTGYTGAGAVVSELPKVNETIAAAITYFLPRVDVLYVDPKGNFKFAKGIPSEDPVNAPIPANVMPIYRVLFNAGTFDENDVAMAFIDNKRYTMRDIGKIEERVARVEEWSTLSLLETETESLEVLSSDGTTNRFKSGFFVDNFEDHLFADFENDQYRASIDPRQGELRPAFNETNIRLFYDATPTDGSSASNVVIKGDFLFMNYTEVVEVAQPLASSSVNVNPYAVITGTGMITLSPESDEWRDVETQTRTIAQTPTARVSPNQTDNFNNWQWNWGGFTETTPAGSFTSGGGGSLDSIFISGATVRLR